MVEADIVGNFTGGAGSGFVGSDCLEISLFCGEAPEVDLMV